jgi:hypothetical protein
LTGDDEFLDLRSAFVDAQRAHVSIKTFDDGAADESNATVNLNGAVDDSTGGFGGEEFCFARFAG